MSHIQVVQSPMNRRQQIPNSKQQHYFVPQPQKRPAAHQINLSVGALPTQTSPQTFQGKQNFSPVNNSY